MNIRKLLQKTLRISDTSSSKSPSGAKKKTRWEMDIIFTAQFYEKAKQCGLTEDHARHVVNYGDVVMQYGKPTNMKVAKHKDLEIGVYVFPDELTSQPVVTSIWKRQVAPRRR